MERSEKIKMISAQRRDQFDDDLKNPQQLPLIADEIRLKVGSIKRNIYDIGKLLTKAKKITDHGKFKEWIKENFEFSYQTAKQLYERLCALHKETSVGSDHPSDCFVHHLL